MTLPIPQIWGRGTFCLILASLLSALFAAVLRRGQGRCSVLELCSNTLCARNVVASHTTLGHRRYTHVSGGEGSASLLIVRGMRNLIVWHATGEGCTQMWHATRKSALKTGFCALNSIAHWGWNVLERLAMRLLFCVFAFFVHGVLWAQPITDLGEISHQNAVQTLKLSVESPVSTMQAQAEKVFGYHGGVTLVSARDAAFTLRFVPKGDRSVELIIESGTPPKVLFKQLVMGEDAAQALLKACDLAVEKTLGVPGFFAGKLAFVGERGGSQEIYTGDLLFSDLHKVTNDKSHSISPHWSPDGKYLTYTGYYLSEFPDLFLVDLNTGKRKAIATYKGTNTGGVFSPSGEQLAMILSSSGNAEVYIADNRGRRPKRITRNKSLEASPTWSPDGQNLIFTSDQLGGPQLFKVDLRTKAQSRIPTNISRYCDEAIWNQRHPNLVAFTAAVNRSFQIALYNFKTRKATFLTNESVDCVEPCWASDGRHLFFTRRTGRDKQLHILDTETGKVRPLHSKEFGSASQASFVYPKSTF